MLEATIEDVREEQLELYEIRRTNTKLDDLNDERKNKEERVMQNNNVYCQ